MSSENSIYLEDISLKEVFYNNAIHMLCKMETLAGNVTVRYNTRTGTFFSLFNHTTTKYCIDLHQSLKMLSLWFYTASVFPDETIMPTDESYHDFTGGKNAALTFSSIGGKLRTNFFNRETNWQIDYERYTEKTVSIAWYIRKLREVQKASESKRNLTQFLRLSLASNETYVDRKY